LDARSILLVAGVAAGLARDEVPAGPKPGEAYPAYVLPSLADGGPLSVAHFRGKKVLLLHFASW
jgi:hypothetical protein